MASPRRVALYARVSTHDQRADLQLHDLRRLAEQRGWKIVSEYVDLGVSGAKDRRPELDRMIKDAHKGRFDVLGIWKLDRLARSVRHLIMLGDEMRALGVDLVSVQDTLDTTSPSGRFTFHVLGAVAELERELVDQGAHRRGCCGGEEAWCSSWSSRLHARCRSGPCTSRRGQVLPQHRRRDGSQRRQGARDARRSKDRSQIPLEL